MVSALALLKWMQVIVRGVSGTGGRRGKGVRIILSRERRRQLVEQKGVRRRTSSQLNVLDLKRDWKLSKSREQFGAARLQRAMMVANSA